MKTKITLLTLLLCFLCFGQYLPKKNILVATNAKESKTNLVTSSDYTALYDNLPVLIPKIKNGKFGYVNQNGKFVVKPEYHVALFFTEDCNLLNSPNEKVKEYGSNEYATVEKQQTSYRIDKKGNIVYQYKKTDLGKCKNNYKPQLYQVYKTNNNYGLINSSVFKNAKEMSNYQIIPHYEYLHLLEGDDLEHPMMIAALNNKFGIIDVNDKIIIPFEYEDIKRNFSWKLGHMFEVTKDGKNYYFIDVRNNGY